MWIEHLPSECKDLQSDPEHCKTKPQILTDHKQRCIVLWP